jgi:WD40 repeat protein
MQITALAVSPNGDLIASGQVGTRHFRGDAAPVFVWSTATGQRLCVLKGLSIKVNVIQFSTDGRFVCGTGEVSPASVPLWLVIDTLSYVVYDVGSTLIHMGR